MLTEEVNQPEAVETVDNQGLEANSENQDHQHNDNNGEISEENSNSETQESEADRNRKGYEARKTREKQRIRDLEQENERLKKQIAPEQQQTRTQAIDPNKPRLEQFNTAEEYMEALTDYKLETRLTQREQQVKVKTLLDQYVERADAYAKENPEFDDAEHYLTGKLPIHVQRAIAKNVVGPQIAFELYKNPELLKKINNLDVEDGLEELFHVAQKIKTAPVKSKSVISNAPPPPRGIKPQGTNNKKSVLDMSTDEYRAHMRSLGG
jgi:hypothetical protein